MTDREVLELAAKAAGIKALRSPEGVLRNCTGFDPVMNIYAAPPWNPLNDDGDALRLAVRLGIGVQSWPRLGLSHAGAETVVKSIVIKELHEGDPYAATRRAIVRAAAEIGRTMAATA